VIDTVFRTESITAARTPEPQLDAMPEPDPEPQPERST
jgi:hypothetical protein